MSSIAIFALIGFPLYSILGVIYNWKPERDMVLGGGFVVASTVFYVLDKTEVSNSLAIPALFFLASGLLMTLLQQIRRRRDDS